MAAYRKVRPHPNEKVERNQKLIEYIKYHPNATMKEIGELFGISDSMVCKIKNRALKTGLVNSR